MMAGLRPDCFRCVHMLGIGHSGWRCEAFEQIPTDIMSRQRLHVGKYEGDRGIRFEAKKTQAQAGYEPVSLDAQRCDNCQHWIPGGSCRIVAGEISPVGWCGGWQNRRDSAEGWAGEVRTDATALPTVAVSPADSAGSSLPAAGVMIVTRGGKVLLLRRSDSGQWAFPGGRIEDGETAEEAALRECAEEIGIRPEISGEWTRRDKDGVDFTTFLGLVPDVFEPVLNDEHTEYRWENVDDLAGQSMPKLGLS